MRRLSLSIICTLSLSSPVLSGNLLLDGEDSGVDSGIAREAFERLGDRFYEESIGAKPDDSEIEVEAPDVSDLNERNILIQEGMREIEPAAGNDHEVNNENDHHDEHDDFDFDQDRFQMMNE